MSLLRVLGVAVVPGAQRLAYLKLERSSPAPWARYLVSDMADTKEEIWLRLPLAPGADVSGPPAPGGATETVDGGTSSPGGHPAETP
jgi:hypothetical protein